jgi:hypothetical protein
LKLPLPAKLTGMKKTFKKLFNLASGKSKKKKVSQKKSLLPENPLVMMFTEQEEREGGFWGNTYLATSSNSKIR